MMNYRDEPIQETNPVQEVVGILLKEMASLRTRLQELKAQVDQMQSQVERERGRYASIASDLRNIKDNLDTVPREDIRDKYDEALDVRFRMAMMGGQYEKIETLYSEMEQKQALISSIVTKLQGFDALPMTVDGVPATKHGGLDMVGFIKAQEDERMRLSRSIHDTIAQSLTNFILQAEICQRLFDRNPERAAEELGALKANASSTFQKVRDFIFELRPMMLDDLGVAPTVRRYIDTYKEKHDIDTTITITGEDRRLENYKEVLIFRSVQDLLTSARDYGSPTEVAVKLDMNGNKVRISVDDDGRPFDVQKVMATEADNSDARVQALRMLRNKLELVGGTLQATSSENDGSSIRLEMPADEQIVS